MHSAGMHLLGLKSGKEEKFMRKMTFIFVVAIVLCGMICSCTNGVSEKETKKSLMIEVPVPERPAGQKDVVNLVTPNWIQCGLGLSVWGCGDPVQWNDSYIFLEQRWLLCVTFARNK